MTHINKNLHTHTSYCDGKGTAEEYIIAAIEKQMTCIGFSGHAPVPFKSWWNMSNENFKNYIKDISFLKEKYINKIEIYLGIEADYIKGIVKPDDFIPYNLDYTIGSIHYLNAGKSATPWDFIISPSVFKKGLEELYKKNIKKLIRDYYEQMMLLADNKSVDIIAHFNQINKFNKNNIYFDETEKKYLQIVRESLEYISSKEKIIEINTRGKFKKLSNEFYPSINILKICKELNINITLSADAHSPNEVNSLLNEAANYAKQAGYKEYISLHKNKQVMLAL